MKIAVFGAHGKIGQCLIPKLISKGYSVRAIIRDPAQSEILNTLGAESCVADLEGEFEHALEGVDAVVFSAGSGGNTGGDKTLLVDLWGAIKTFDACHAHGVKRYIMISSRRAHDPDDGPEKMQHYLVAKHIADEYLSLSGLDYSILRPGTLTDGPGTGTISAGQHINHHGHITREDTADCIIHCLEHDQTIGQTIALLEGPTAIAQAIAQV